MTVRECRPRVLYQPRHVLGGSRAPLRGRSATGSPPSVPTACRSSTTGPSTSSSGSRSRPWLKVSAGTRVLDVGLRRRSLEPAAGGAWRSRDGCRSESHHDRAGPTARRRRRASPSAATFACRICPHLDVGEQFDLVLGVTVLQHILDPRALRAALDGDDRAPRSGRPHDPARSRADRRGRSLRLDGLHGRVSATSICDLIRDCGSRAARAHRRRSGAVQDTAAAAVPAQAARARPVAESAGAGDRTLVARRCAVRPARRQAVLACRLRARTKRSGKNHMAIRASVGNSHRCLRVARRAGRSRPLVRDAARFSRGVHGERRSWSTSPTPAIAGPGTLREALFLVAGATGPTNISIEVPTIQLETALPAFVEWAWGEARRAGLRCNDRCPGAERAARCSMSRVPTPRIEGITISNCPAAAILVRSVHFRLSASTIESCDVGVEVAENASDTLLERNHFLKNRLGVRFGASGHNTSVANNEFIEDKDAGLVGGAQRARLARRCHRHP